LVDGPDAATGACAGAGAGAAAGAGAGAGAGAPAAAIKGMANIKHEKGETIRYDEIVGQVSSVQFRLNRNVKEMWNCTRFPVSLLVVIPVLLLYLPTVVCPSAFRAPSCCRGCSQRSARPDCPR
jgi:hypothetical protein